MSMYRLETVWPSPTNVPLKGFCQEPSPIVVHCRPLQVPSEPLTPPRSTSAVSLTVFPANASCAMPSALPFTIAARPASCAGVLTSNEVASLLYQLVSTLPSHAAELSADAGRASTVTRSTRQRSMASFFFIILYLSINFLK